MKQWDVSLTYTRSLESVNVTMLTNRLHPERITVTDDELRLTVRIKGETLTDAIITALGKVEQVCELALEAVWAEEAVVLVPA